MTYRQRREAKAERLREWSGKRKQKATAAFQGARSAVAGIPFGQPILVGHHSEKRHRRDLDRHDVKMRAGIEHAQTAERMERTADEIERQAEHAIYSDDPDAIERLEEKLAGLEAQRETMKARNAAFRKAHRAELKAQTSAYQRDQAMPHQAYELQNLGGNISRARERLKRLKADRGPRPASERPAPAQAETATARAGLVITAGQTKPTRPGKLPRPVWTVSGNVAFWKPLLFKLGGTAWLGSVSFWDDPTELLEAALLADEQAAADEAAKETATA
jgi:hypothetical protein